LENLPNSFGIWRYKFSIRWWWPLFSVCSGMIKNHLHSRYFLFTCFRYGYGC
jgi:hypothetical protein